MRYKFSERLMHSCAAVSYVYLLLTGLAFWSPSFYWIATVLGGGSAARAMHPRVGVVFAAVAAWRLVTWVADAHHRRGSGGRGSDVALSQRINMCRRADGSTTARRCSSAMTLSAFVLLLSGLVLWFPESIPHQRRWCPIAILVCDHRPHHDWRVHRPCVYMGVVVVPNGRRS